MNTMQFFLLHTEMYAMLIPFFIALSRYKGAPQVLKMAILYITVLTIQQLSANVLWYQKQNNFFLFHIGNMAESIALLLMYREIFKKYVADTNKYVYRQIFIVLIPLFIVFAIVNAIYWQPLTAYPSNTRTVLSIMTLLFSTLFFHKPTYEPIPKSYRELPSHNASRTSLFWINMGLLWFHAFSLIQSLYTNIFLKELSKEAYINLAVAHAIFTIILYVFLFIGFLKAKRVPKVIWEGEEKEDENKH